MQVEADRHTALMSLLGQTVHKQTLSLWEKILTPEVGHVDEA